MNKPHQPALFIGIDWADKKHDIYVIDRNGKGFHRELEHSPENIDAWVGEMLKLAGGRPIAIMLEQSRGALIYALMFREDVLLYPLNPKQLARYRESYPGGGARTIPPTPCIWRECCASESQLSPPGNPRTKTHG